MMFRKYFLNKKEVKHGILNIWPWIYTNIEKKI